MQRHRKYLVITIWISTIAFVGAGFVGWGAYDFNKDRSGAVATVGERKISIKEFQKAYANYYNYYNSMMGGKLDQETADKLKLDELTLTNLINQALLLSYADEIGLDVLDEEVQQSIVDDTNFHTDGKFDKQKYFDTLKGARLEAKDYEESLKKDILMKKVSALLTLQPTEQEMEMIAASTFMKDKLKVSVLSDENIYVDVSDEEIQSYYDANKQNFLTPKRYDIDIVQTLVSTVETPEDELQTFYEETKHDYKDSEGKLLSYEEAKDQVIVALQKKVAKKEALKTYLDFKKGDIQKEANQIIDEQSELFDLEKYAEAKEGDFIKPIELDDRFVSIKLNKVLLPEPKSLEEAKDEMLEILTEQKRVQELEKLAQNRLELFNGEDVGFVSRDDIDKLSLLSPESAAQFLNEVFSSNESKGYKIIDNKAILYEIVEQQLLDESKLENYGDLLRENLSRLKDSELNDNLVKLLHNRYEIHRYYKGR